jgi:hypothetical protein
LSRKAAAPELLRKSTPVSPTYECEKSALEGSARALRRVASQECIKPLDASVTTDLGLLLRQGGGTSNGQGTFAEHGTTRRVP